jgi:LPXTG-motif cell wall-anchored protein
MRVLTRVLAVIAVAGLLMLALPAYGQEKISGGNLQEPRNPSIQGITEEQGTADDTTGSLPFTGADITLFVVIGLAAIGTGALIIRKTRARPQQS